MTVEGFNFRKNQRLLTKKQFQRVFDQVDYRFSSPLFMVLTKESSEVEGKAKLGLVVAKKHLPTAVKRNSFKRVVRESFRLNQHQLTGLDLIILARSGANKANNEEIAQLLNKSWKFLNKKRYNAIGSSGSKGVTTASK